MNVVMNTVLLIEDDPNITELLRLYLERTGFRVLEARDGDSGLAFYYDEKPGLILLDIMLPERDGWEVCRFIRLDDRKIPILMLTGKGESEDVVKGLELGADDYIIKPFDPNEVVARMRAVSRRSGHISMEQTIEMEELTIWVNEYRVFSKGSEVVMAPREFEMLVYFAEHPGQVLSREQVLDTIWGEDFSGDERTVDVHVKRVREKLRQAGSPWTFTAVRGIGYRFEEIREL